MPQTKDICIRNAHFPWRFDQTAKEKHNFHGGLNEKAKEMRTFLGDLMKQPRKSIIFLAV